MDPTTTTETSKPKPKPKPVLVFGASGEQGRAVIEGFVDCGEELYSPIYAFSHWDSNSQANINDQQYLSDALNCFLLTGDIGNPQDVSKAIKSTQAQVIFLVTTTEFPEANDIHDASPIRNAMDAEYDVIIQFFNLLKQITLEEEKEKIIKRTVLFSTRVNVEKIYKQHLLLLKEEEKKTNDDQAKSSIDNDDEDDDWLQPLDDGSVVAHYTAKGKAGEDGLKIVNGIDNLNVILLTVPFFYSNFLAFFAPLPTNDQNTEWELNACFGNGTANKIDMMSASDLSIIVPNLVEQSSTYRGQNLYIGAEKISMDEIASEFSDLFGKDVIYNPLLPKELAAMDFPSAPAMAQMCQFISDPRYNDHRPKHDIELTTKLMKKSSTTGNGSGHYHHTTPTTFKDWLLTHSDSTAFTQVGLDIDGDDIINVTVFAATSPYGKSVISGLLADTRKQYKIRAATRQDINSSCDVQAIKDLDKESKGRIEIINADFNDLSSCLNAVKGVDGVFLLADFYAPLRTKEEIDIEEKHTQTIIDACETSKTVKHLVIATLEGAQEVNKSLPEKELLQFSPRARMAAYARTKKLRVSYMLLPCYPELFLNMIDKQVDPDSGNEKLVLEVPLKDQHTKVAIFGLDELGSAVANVFDSYECYAGHEIGLVSDFVSVSDVKEALEGVFSETTIEIQKSEERESAAAATTTTKEQHIQPNGTYMKDLGQLFASLSHAPEVRSRHSVAKTFKLVPSAKNLRRWVEQNQDNPVFREKLGLR